MKKRYVTANYPIRLPFVSTALYSFLLYYFDVNHIWWGVFGTVYIFYWIIAIVSKFQDVRVDIEDLLKKIHTDKE